MADAAWEGVPTREKIPIIDYVCTFFLVGTVQYSTVPYVVGPCRFRYCGYGTGTTIGTSTVTVMYGAGTVPYGTVPVPRYAKNHHE